MPVCLAIKVRLEREEIAVTSRNLSLKGPACSPNSLLRKNCRCEVVITLAPDVQAVIKGQVVRADESGAAIDFMDMDPESFVHLRKIVEYHSQYPEELSRELLTPVFPLFRSPNPFTSRKPRK